MSENLLILFILKMPITKSLKFLLAIILLLIYSSCQFIKNENNLTKEKLEELIYSAAAGNKTSNDSLQNLFDLNLPNPTEINDLNIDSLSVEGKKFYSVLIEFPNPIYNRFAVYDSSYKLYILDKSLNGYLSLQKNNQKDFSYFLIKENFNTQNIIQLNRKSIYLMKKDSVYLAFRNFTSYDDGKIILTQKINDIQPDYIETNISTKNFVTKKNKNLFFFDKQLNKYISNSNYNDMVSNQTSYFDSLVINLVKSKAPKTKNSLIYNEVSSLISCGIKTSNDSIQKYNNFKNVNEQYSLFVPIDWKILKETKLSNHINQILNGTRLLYSDSSIISIVKINPIYNAEDYLNYKLANAVKGKYLVRYSDKIQLDNKYVQFFEISFFNLKYLIIFECPISSYEKNKQIYENIINSFSIG
ncbi:MAG: hypothetical protein STSR0008_10020 [Ignavibacterium sp.]